MKFYDCKTAPSPRLVRIFIAEKGLDIPTQEVDLRGGEHLADAFRKINPYCTVPVLELDDGTRLTSTQGCWRYLEAAYPEPPLLGASATEKGIIADRVWRIEMDGLAPVAELLRNSAPGLKDRALPGPVNYAQIPELAARGKARLEHFLGNFDRLLDGKPYLAGDRFSAADIIGLVAVDFAGRMKVPLPEDQADAHRWHETVSARPSAGL